MAAPGKNGQDKGARARRGACGQYYGAPVKMIRDVTAERGYRDSGDSFYKTQPSKGEGAVRDLVDLEPDNNGQGAACQRKKADRADEIPDIAYL